MPIGGAGFLALGIAVLAILIAGLLSLHGIGAAREARNALRRERRLAALGPARRHERAVEQGWAIEPGRAAEGWSPPLDGWRAGLVPDDAARLDAALADLAATGTAFAFRLDGADGAAWRVSGMRAEAEGTDLLWIGDAVPERLVRERLAEDGARLAAEAMRLRCLLDGLPLPVWERGRDLTLLYCNRAYAEAVEAASPLAAVLDERELGAGVFGRDGRELARRAQRSRRAYAESRTVVVGGARRLLEFNESPSADGVAGHARDVTALEDLQADVSRLIEAHAEVLEQLHSGIAIFGPDRRLRFANRAYRTLWHLDRAFLAGEPDISEILELLRERRRLPEVVDFQSMRKGYVEAFRSVIEPVEDHLYLPDGSVIRQLIAPHPQGGLVMLFEDVTDRIALERSYNTLIAVQRESLNALTEGIAVFGQDGRLSLHNPAFAALWHIDEADLAGRPHVSELVERSRGLHRVDDAEWPEYKRAAVSSVLARMPVRRRLRRADGSVVEISIAPLADGSSMFGTADITARDEVERALTERNAALEEADKLKSRFVANVSYELRTPLNTILGFGEILANGYFGTLNPRQMEYCAGIIEASQRLAALIEDILDLATVEAGQVQLVLEPVSVAALLHKVGGMARERAQLAEQQVLIDVDPNAGTVVGDERRLRQLLFSLVGNALQFTPAGGTVRLSGRRRDDRVEMIVADSGPGIAVADRDRVFLAFERGDAEGRRTSGGGAGLGLTLVKRLVELHGGSVRVSGEPGHGTVVEVGLPVDGPAEEPGAAQQAAGVPPL